jgi:hypothetical protein
VVADLPDEEGQATGPGVVQGREDLPHVQRGVADVDETDRVAHDRESRTGSG